MLKLTGALALILTASAAHASYGNDAALTLAATQQAPLAMVALSHPVGFDGPGGVVCDAPAATLVACLDN